MNDLQQNFTITHVQLMYARFLLSFRVPSDVLRNTLQYYCNDERLIVERS